MSDNIQLDAGSGGAVLATEDESSVHYQKIKLTASGTGTTEGLSKAEDSAHSGGEHGIMALAVRNDVLAALAGTDGDYAPLQVSDTGALYADISELAGNAIALNNGAATAGTLRVTIASDSTGVLSIDDNSGSITVDGTVTASLGATDNAVLDSIDAAAAAIQAAVEVIDDAISGSEMQVDLVSAQVTNAGTFAAQVDGDALTALQLIDNIVLAEDAAHQSGDSGVMALAVRDTAPSSVSGTDGDYEPLHISDDGGLWVSMAASHQGGSSFFSSIDLDESEEEVSATACTVAYLYFWNATAAPLWAQLFDATASAIAPGTDAPDMNFPIPANADSDVAGVTIPVPQGGIQFGTALSVAVTTGSGTDAGAPGANDAGAIIIYKN